MYPKDTEKWKQFTTALSCLRCLDKLFCIPKILKNESNSQQAGSPIIINACCFVSQRYWKMKAIHNCTIQGTVPMMVVLYPKDTEKWKQFTTLKPDLVQRFALFCIPKILKNESNSQLSFTPFDFSQSCFVSQRYWKMKAIHNYLKIGIAFCHVVLYPKDTEKWKQFTTSELLRWLHLLLFCIPKILKNESNSQHT